MWWRVVLVRDLLSIASFPKHLPGPRLSQNKARCLQFHQGLPHGCSFTSTHVSKELNSKWNSQLLVLTRDTGYSGQGLAHYASVLAPHKYCY